ncbi:MAG TPA: DUF6268 family outer membrane beta-barrel protein [Chthoniobacterales bacterium]|nr:DUF6268 family outer membrane beta-barrel protein [Chthoniobacterales bacterium]
MKQSIRLFVAALCLTSVPLFAGTETNYSTTAATQEGNKPFGFEFSIEGAYIGEADVERGVRQNRDFETTYTAARFVLAPLTKVGYLRIGASWERWEFDGLDSFIAPVVPGSAVLARFNSQLPDTLQSVTGIIGLDTKLSDAFLVRFEAYPGFYGTDDLGDGTFNVPMVLGGSYVYSSDLQFIVGVSVNYERDFPVIPGGGIRWRMSSNFVLNAVLPTPRLEWELSRKCMLYVGVNVKGSTFRTEDNFGDTRRDDRLGHAVLTYTEIRTGAGFEFKITPQIKLSAEGGYVPYRSFDYHRADVRYKHEQGAPYGAVSFRAAF